LFEPPHHQKPQNPHHGETGIIHLTPIINHQNYNQMKFSLIIFSLIILTSFTINVNYMVKYHLDYKPDSTNSQRTMSSDFTLYIKSNDFSICASDNSLQRDSVSTLIEKGVLTDADIMSNPQLRFSARFTQFVNKSYSKNDYKIYEIVGPFPYVYSMENELKWSITTQQDTILGYNCTKATTYYAGRNYEAWFTPDIPISDGPYVFRGLPGLIVQIADTRKHYIFVLRSFGKCDKDVAETPVYRKQKPMETSRAKVFAAREEYRKDGLAYISRATGHSFAKATETRNGVTVPAKSADRSWDNNPLELK
jgi:GLPGLI family protein